MAHTHEYDCQACNAHFDSAEELRRHNEMHHSGQSASSRSGNAEPIGNERPRSSDTSDRQSRR
jgi:hypothetical protein